MIWSYAIQLYLFISPFSIILVHVKAISVSFFESEDMFCEEQKVKRVFCAFGSVGETQRSL